MKISIITVCLNSEKTISKTIESIIKQEHRPYEYIIIDGESNDNTLKIAESYRDSFKKNGVEYEIFSKKDGGIYNAMNIGISKCRGEIIAILNSDDWYENFTLLTVVDYLNKRSEVDIVHGDLIFHESGIVSHHKPKDTEQSLFWKGMTLHHPTFFVRKHVYQKIRYDESYKIISDYLFVLQTKRAGFKYGYINKPLVNMNSGGVGSAFKRRINEGHRARVEAGYPQALVYLTTLNRILITFMSKAKKILFRILR
jgi:glycosyltransferase involved in cell wall biosynthesis